MMVLRVKMVYIAGFASEHGIHKLDERKCVRTLRQYPKVIDQ